ncbi:MAG: GntR family transcriptional regulator [Pontiellaceae bacterium]|nr:GntR family transcriptional regulator [Pontiellaceae bacterium]MBN2784874.1 GntR family transcriptional regulator [Pontiellaceae bacterium]
MPPKKKSESGALSRSPESREFLYQQIATELRKEIDNGTFAAGSRLPSMDDLAVKFKVNKITVLKALDELKNEGSIYSIPARGTYVTKINKDENKPRKNSAFTVGLLSHVLNPREFGPYHMGIITGIQDELSRRKSNLLLMPAGEIHTDAELYQMALEAAVDAMIYLGPFNNALLNRLIQNGVPSVVVDYSYKGCPTDSILVDNPGGGFLILEHLLELGHRRIAVITGLQDHAATAERMGGIAQALDSAQMKMSDLIMFNGDYTRKSGYDAACTILQDHKDCTAICCMNDEMAAGALQAIYAHSDLKVPQDITVTGFDDVQLSAITHPPLTSIHLDIRHMGRIAVQRLMDRMEDQESNPTSTLISTHLVIRDSSAEPV